MRIKRATEIHPGQQSLFGADGEVIVPQPRILRPGEIDHLVRRRFADLLHGADRIQVSRELSAMLGYPITEAMLAKYASLSAINHRLPLAVGMAAERHFGAPVFSDLWAQVQGGVFVYGEHVVALRMGELALESRALREWWEGRRR